jgi:asparagine N-glycosylation enzyme membrane subunit Stt3
MPAPARTPVLLALLACVAVFAFAARELNNRRLTYSSGGDPSAGWFSTDPDGLYHTRRLARFLDEHGPVAERDPLLSHPEGARIPWPPYYTLALAALLGPFTPDGAARDDWLERAVATIPLAFAVLAALVAACAAWRAAGAGAAAVAGATVAWLGASLDYTVPGIGDHHAWATLLMAVMFALTALAFEDGRAPRARMLLGATAGVFGGVLLGSWVAGLVHVLIVQLALGWLVIRHGRRAVAGLAGFGLAFHVALALAVLPAVLSLPWMIVNLSWFHLAQPLLGALVFVPLLWIEPATRGARRYPWIVAAALALVGLLVSSGIREGFAWAGRANTFMAYITESQPLLWGQIGGAGVLTEKLGLAVWLALPAWATVAWRAFRGGRAALLVWAVAFPPMLAQALLQRRFGEALGVPLGVVLGIGLASLPRMSQWPAWGLGASGLLLGCLLQWPTVHHTVRRTNAGEYYLRGPGVADQRSFRAMTEWLGEHGDGGVLAAWDMGHAIEWAAGRPTVATNFGSYVGEGAYLAPWRFFLSEDQSEAEALLEEHDVQHVFVHSGFSKDLEVMLRLVKPDERGEFVEVRRGEGPRPGRRWYATMGAQLLLTGRRGDPATGRLVGSSLPFLRLVHIAPDVLRSPMPIPHTGGQVPAGWIWEHVPGAWLEARGEPGDRLRVSFDISYPTAERKVLWIGEARAGSDGVARLRVPYCTRGPNGDGAVDGGTAAWDFGDRAGGVAIPERAVLAGETVVLP